MQRHAIALATALVLTTACIPYTVGNTAQTIAPGERKTTTSYWIMPNGLGLRADSLSKPRAFPGVDYETRWGIDDESDFALRVPSGSGIVANYKRRTFGYPHVDSAAFAWELGGGVVNWAEHALGQFTLLANTAKHGSAQWYGGARVMHVLPMSQDAANDEPTIGGVLGARFRIGTEEFLPEIAIYHDPSALGIRKSDIIYVPSLSVRSDRVFRLPGLFRLRR
jgi:hypothetical protein